MDELPDYERPPVVETVLGVQFDRLPKFTNGHLGAFWKTLDQQEWCSVADAPPLSPQFERFAEAARWAKGLTLQFSQDQGSRLKIRNQDDDRMIQIQNGRFHFNWLGEGESDYPRYNRVLDGFKWALSEFISFIRQSGVGEFRPNQWEVTYVNHIPKGSVWNKPSDWNFFRPLGSLPDIEDLVAQESFSGEWRFEIPSERGRLHIQWQHAKSVIEGKDVELVRLALTARGPLHAQGTSEQSVADGLNLGRRIIVRAFSALMSEDANRFWGVKHADPRS